jgi:hypothetical protein
MEVEKLFKIVILELTTDNLKLEFELEKTINSDLTIDEKTSKIKDLLSKIVNTEAMLTKFNSMVSNNNN